MSDTPDLDKAREVVYALAHSRDRASTLQEFARLILEQRAEEAERWKECAFGRASIASADYSAEDALYSIGRRAKDRAADLRRQAGGKI